MTETVSGTTASKGKSTCKRLRAAKGSRMTGWERSRQNILLAGLVAVELAKAVSFLAEAPRVLQHGAIGSYLASAPHLIVVSWAGELARRVRVTNDGPW